MTVRTAVQLYALKDPWAADRRATLERVAEIGIQGVEGFMLGDVLAPRAERVRNAAEIRALLDGTGLVMTGAHTHLPPLDDADWMFEEMNALGTPYVISSTTERILGFTRDALSDADRIPRIADRLNGLAELGRAHGIAVGYHNHWWEWVDVAGRPAFERLVDLLDPAIALEIDLFWAHAAGQDLPALIRRHDERVRFVHVKDGDGKQGTPQVVSGTGEVPLAAALDAATHLDWAVLELDLIAPEADVWDIVTRSAAWLRARG